MLGVRGRRALVEPRNRLSPTVAVGVTCATIAVQSALGHVKTIPSLGAEVVFSLVILGALWSMGKAEKARKAT